MTEQTLSFQAEVAKLLRLVANSLYSEKEIFLRELVSNASDACDRLRYEALTNPALLEEDPELEVTLSVDEAAKTLTIADNGVGMNRDDLIQNLGTIAHSGSSAYLEQMTGDNAKDVQLIGQFGVGFYSAFMVADRVEVTSRKAGETQGWRWVSEGTGEFTVAEADKAERGTAITLHLKAEEADEYLNEARIRHVLRTYCDHIALPIRYLGKDGAAETVNTASALWTRPKSDISADQYREFYHHVGHLGDEPWLTLHAKAEGVIEYTSLLFVPSSKPHDLFHPDRKPNLKLYVKRVFITDDCEELIPPYLRFLRGVVDSEDLPLNISREMLQNNPVLAKIRSGLVKRVLVELEKKADKAADEYAAFWDNFGAVLKEGLYEDGANRDRLMKLVRFATTAGEGLSSLEDYLGRMKPGQEAIYYITGEDVDALKRSPQLEGFLAKGVEVLLLDDPVDDFWLSLVFEHDGKPFKSVTRGGADLAAIEGDEAKKSAEETGRQDETVGMDSLIAAFKLALGDAVKDVRVSSRLTESPVCLVADDGDIDMHLERLLKAHKQYEGLTKRILEINPGHELVRSLAGKAADGGTAPCLDEAAHLLLDQARILEGEALPDPVGFSRRLNDFMARGLLSE